MNAAPPVLNAIGVISGTSMDGIDVALIASDGEARVEPGDGATFAYPREVRRALQDVIANPGAAHEPLDDLQRAVTDSHVAAVLAFIEKFGVRRDGVALVGLHGQTILHRPREGFTRQLCDGARASRLLGLDVVNDFRAADVAAGGEGAPFVPLYHAAICAGLERPLMVLNWGGVGNVTYLGADGAIVAFDTGPANALIDDFIGRRRGLTHDEGGALAAAGRVDAGVLARLIGDPYFDGAPPKSLDRNHFHALAREVEKLGDEDGAATLAAFTIEATAAALRHFVRPPLRWLVCGGGRRNLTLMDALDVRLGAPVEPIEAIGYDGDVIEAQCFAYLALRSRRGLPLSLPTTTGAPRPMPGGVFWPAPKAA
ncbi:MAG: anhydro-N-acetylmuramic acid kinase [Roseiarcus sp.]|jgi:anhydro-N-acetylmuramic acid kinase